MNAPIQVPGPTIRRLSLYLRQLESLEANRVETVSSHKLAQPLGFTDAQVRKDLAYLGQFGRPGVGYEVTPLIRRLRGIFGTNRISMALLVGAGNLGKAVAAYQGFRPRGFEVAAVFDNDADKVGQRVGALTVQPMSELEETAARHGARLAMVAVPAPAAQAVADELVAVGIRGILNFAPIRLNVSPAITVRNIDVAAEMEQLNFQTSVAFPEASQQREVLVVEDSDAGVLFVSQIVEDIGHRVRVARNGIEALEAMRLRRPDLVVLDLMLPRKSGIAVFQEMKADPGLKGVPVLIVSGASELTGVNLKTGDGHTDEAQGSDVMHGLGVVLHEQLSALAPDDIVEKPIDPQILTERLKALLP